MTDPVVIPTAYALYEPFHSSGPVKVWSGPYIPNGGDQVSPNDYVSMGGMSNDGFEFNHKVSYSMREVQQLFYALGAYMTKQELDLKFTLKHINPVVAYRYAMGIPGGQKVITTPSVSTLLVATNPTFISATQINDETAWVGVAAGDTIQILQGMTSQYAKVLSIPPGVGIVNRLNVTPETPLTFAGPTIMSVFKAAEGNTQIPLGEPSDILLSGADATQGQPLVEPEYRQWLFQFAAPGFNFGSAGIRKAAYAYIRLWKAAVISHGALKHTKTGEADIQLDVKAFADLSVAGPNQIGKIYIPTPVGS